MRSAKQEFIIGSHEAVNTSFIIMNDLDNIWLCNFVAQLFYMVNYVNPYSWLLHKIKLNQINIS